MSANLSTDAVRPSEGGGATYRTNRYVNDASPVALKFLRVLSGPGIENPLSPALREELLHRFGSTGNAELSSLLGESDSELFHEGLIRLAGRQERAGRVPNAALLYQAVSELASGETAVLAKRRLAVLQGSGEIGDRAEFLLSRFFHELSDPAPLLAMSAAGLAFRAAGAQPWRVWCPLPAGLSPAARWRGLWPASSALAPKCRLSARPAGR